MNIREWIPSYFISLFEKSIHRLPKIQRVSFLSPLRINRHVDGDAVEPGIEGRATLKTLNFSIGSKKRLLRNLQSILTVAKQPGEHDVNFLVVTRDKFLESILFSRLALLDQLPVA